MQETIKSFEDLEVWRGGIDLTMRCYAIVATLPSSERFELSSQMRRCAVSIPANIAEGHARRLPRPFLNHVNIALGSLAEWVTYLVIAERLGFITNATFKTERSDAERMAQMLGALARALERRISRFKLGMTVGATALCVVAGTWWQALG